MGRGHASRHRGDRSRSNRKTLSRTSAGRTVHHPLYGDIPMIPVISLGPDGEDRETWDYDPDYRPPMPSGAVRGDISRQEFCGHCHVPRYFYVDQERVCVQCSRVFVFSAKEQKFWYESLKFHFDSKAIRCPNCRRQRRNEKALRGQIALAKEAIRAEPHDPIPLLDLARATVRYRQLTQEGDLEGAIAACRKAISLWPQAHEALYWEAFCHHLAGRHHQARELFTEFLGQSRSTGRHLSLKKEATAYLREVDASSRSTATNPTEP